jgi:CubicO group peptidase (beta-lactamase class C family)
MQLKMLLKILLSSIIAIVSIVFYVVLFGGVFHSPQCILFKYQCPPVSITGTVDKRFEQTVKKLYTHNFEIGREIGSCLSATVNGTQMIDLCGGTTLDNKPYNRDNLQMVFSVSKAISKIVITMLVDRGHLKYEDKVSKYWPEFAQGGKENVTVGDVVRHSSGVIYLDEVLQASDLLDLDKMAVVLARQPHNFNSTKTVGYHTISQGFYLNEIIRRSDPQKRTIGQFIREEINKPLGVEFYIGVPENVRHRVTRLKTYPVIHFFLKELSRVFLDFIPFIPSHPSKAFFKQIMNKETVVAKSFNKVVQGVPDYNHKLFLDAEMPAVNGFTNIKSLSILAQLMANKGTVNGVRLISEETATKAMTLYETEFDTVLHKNITRTVGGFGVFSVHPNYKMMGWAGMGGSLIIWNPEHNISFTYVMNAMLPGLATTEGRALDLCIQFLNQLN